MQKTYTFKGSTDFISETNAYVTIRTTGEFYVTNKDNEILGPKSASSREFKMFLKEAETIIIRTGDDVLVTLILSEQSPRGEVVSSESLVEIIPESEMSIYDRLRGEMLAKLNEMAEARGLDTWDDEDDYEYEDDEGDTPLTPYEYEVMQDEYLQSKKDETPPSREQTISDDSVTASASNAEVASESEAQ